MPLHPALAPGRVAVVTGAASGIGLAAARRFAQAGMRVCVADLEGDGLGRAADAVVAASGGRGADVIAVPTDVGRRGDVEALREALAHELRNAGGGLVTGHLLIPGFVYTGFTRARGVAENPAGAWTPEEVIEFLLAGMARGDFYILCPDNETTPAMDRKRIRWAAEDIVQNR